MTEPTDAEIDVMVAAYLGDCGPQATRVYSFARAVLAKWGTPAPVGVKPVAQVNAEGFIVECGDLLLAPGLKLYTADQVLAMGENAVGG